MMDAIERFLHILRNAGARLAAGKTYITARGREFPDELEQGFFSALSEPRRTSPEKWIPGRKVRVITTNTIAGTAVREKKSRQPEKKAPESLREKRDRLRREVERLEGKHEKK